jgi:hypothetical protein
VFVITRGPRRSCRKRRRRGRRIRGRRRRWGNFQTTLFERKVHIEQEKENGTLVISLTNITLCTIECNYKRVQHSVRNEEDNSDDLPNDHSYTFERLISSPGDRPYGKTT